MSYGNLCTQFYDLDKPTAPLAEVNYFAGVAATHPGPVLEPMCGSGRLLVPLAQRGIEIEGFDRSSSMLSACGQKLQAANLHATIKNASFETYDPARLFGYVFIALGSICLLTDPKIVSYALGRIHSWLQPGGVFVFDFDLCHHKESFGWPTGGRWLKTANGDLLSLHWTGHYTHEDQIAHSLGRYELIRDGRIVDCEVEQQEVKLYTPQQMVSLLRETGFSSVQIDGLHGGEANEDTAETMTCIATK